MNGHWRGDSPVTRLAWILLMAWVLIQPALETGQFLRKAAAAVAQAQEVSSSTTAVTPQSAPPRYLIVAPDELAASLGGYIAAKQAQGLDVTLHGEDAYSDLILGSPVFRTGAESLVKDLTVKTVREAGT